MPIALFFTMPSAYMVRRSSSLVRRSIGELLGSLMNDSHASLRDDFASSSDALDAIVEAARSAPGCLGARVTGAGFAGCAVAAVRSEDVDAFIPRTAEPSDGATLRSAGQPPS